MVMKKVKFKFYYCVIFSFYFSLDFVIGTLTVSRIIYLFCFNMYKNKLCGFLFQNLLPRMGPTYFNMYSKETH